MIGVGMIVLMVGLFLGLHQVLLQFFLGVPPTAGCVPKIARGLGPAWINIGRPRLAEGLGGTPLGRPGLGRRPSTSAVYVRLVSARPVSVRLAYVRLVSVLPIRVRRLSVSLWMFVHHDFSFRPQTWAAGPLSSGP